MDGKPLKGYFIPTDGGVILQFLGWLSAVTPKIIMFEPVIRRYMFKPNQIR
jgi:hypothetical protein